MKRGCFMTIDKCYTNKWILNKYDWTIPQYNTFIVQRCVGLLLIIQLFFPAIIINESVLILAHECIVSFSVGSGFSFCFFYY